MDLNYTSEDLAFRDSVRTFLEANLPADLQQKVRKHLRLSKADYVRWHKILAKQGWVAPGWPAATRRAATCWVMKKVALLRLRYWS